MTKYKNSAYAEINEKSESNEPRRLKTRRKIIESAHKCFMERGFSGASIEDIVIAAGISRPTFYLHYSNKETILFDILRTQQPPLNRIFARLRDLPELSLAAIHGWLGHYMAAVRAHSGHLYLFSLGQIYNAEHRSLIVQQRMDLIELLGTRHPGFRLMPGDERKTVKCLYMMFQLEQMVAALARVDTFEEEQTALDVMAEQLLEFLPG